MAKRIMVTGGAGFIGSNFIRFALQARPDLEVLNYDALTYAGNLENLRDVENNPRYQFIHGDVCDPEAVPRAMNKCEAVVHFAAESHVDRSIMDSTPFVRTNVTGTQVLLDAARKTGLSRFLHVSTDEVYGSLPLDAPELKFTEATPLDPSSPYAASKAASDLMVQSAHRTFGLDTVITRCSNNFGPYQFPEKVIPLFVTNLLQNQPIPLYGDGLNVRDWLHVEDHCEALLHVLERGEAGEVYNVGGNNERSNLELTHTLLEIMGHGREMIRHVQDRPGHDRRYAIDASKIARELGWQPSRSQWPDALVAATEWYKQNDGWWQRVRSGAYREYYQAHYGKRLA